MRALEEYTAHHADTVEEIMYRWPWRRFEGLFRLHLLRKAREELRQMRDLRLAALDANMNFDSQENSSAKQQRADGLQDAFRQVEVALYSDAPMQDPDVAVMEADPLFAPINERARQLRNEINRPLVEQAGMGRQLIEAT
jgi:hypothetical protein